LKSVQKSIVNDRTFFWLVVGVSVAVPAVVTLLKYLPDELRPNARFARFLPALNAMLNSAVAVCLLLGYYFIRNRKNKAVHQVFMFSAFLLSAVFLISYVIYHTTMPSTPHGGEGFILYLYYFILFTHIVLAALILPMVLYTIYFSTSGNFTKHKKIARITFPLWLYVAVTGVLVYVMISPYYTFAA
jgi:putative membrane protein